MIPGESFYIGKGSTDNCKAERWPWKTIGESKMENLQLTQHFQSDEFWCSCGCGKEGPNGNHISQSLVLKLEIVRTAINKPMKINSGIRCLEYNRSIKSSDTSSHIKCVAADISCTQMSDRHLLMSHLPKLFERIGIHKDFIHVDIDTDKRRGIFVYNDPRVTDRSVERILNRQGSDPHSFLKSE